MYKFRSLRPTGQRTEPIEDEQNSRITHVGGFLRRTHMAKISQLILILFGVSVLGLRAAWTDEERHPESVTEDWRKRWFVKPGLTGLAQINDVSSTDPDAKLRYDIEYICKQGF